MSADGDGQPLTGARPERVPGWQTPGWWLRRVAVPVLALTVIVGAIVWLQRPESEPERRVAESDEPLDGDTGAPQEGALAPDFTLETLDGEQVKLSDYRGKVVLLNFWATWCGPCRDEMPLLDEAHQDHAADGLVVLAINVEESAGQVRDFVGKLGLSLPVALDSKGTVSRRYRVRSYPTTYFVGRDGRIEGRRVGEYTRSILTGRLEQLLEPEAR